MIPVVLLALLGHHLLLLVLKITRALVIRESVDTGI